MRSISLCALAPIVVTAGLLWGAGCSSSSAPGETPDATYCLER